MIVPILQVHHRAEQGVTKPFRCQGDDGHWYYVKGRGAGQRSLICEWLAGRMAQAFGLPVAPFAQVDVPDALIETSIRSDLAELGAGLAFGSREITHSQELMQVHLGRIAPSISRDILVFDWWVHNQDRTLTRHGGNPNLLWDQGKSELVVIDHNQAFDPGFDAASFAEQHVFIGKSGFVCDDFADRAGYLTRFETALTAFDDACAEVPESWWWVDDGVPTNFDVQTARNLLLRYTQDEFWSVK